MRHMKYMFHRTKIKKENRPSLNNCVNTLDFIIHFCDAKKTERYGVTGLEGK